MNSIKSGARKSFAPSRNPTINQQISFLFPNPILSRKQTSICLLHGNELFDEFSEALHARLFTDDEENILKRLKGIFKAPFPFSGCLYTREPLRLNSNIQIHV